MAVGLQPALRLLAGRRPQRAIGQRQAPLSADTQQPVRGIRQFSRIATALRHLCSSIGVSQGITTSHSSSDRSVGYGLQVSMPLRHQIAGRVHHPKSSVRSARFPAGERLRRLVRLRVLAARRCTRRVLSIPSGFIVSTELFCAVTGPNLSLFRVHQFISGNPSLCVPAGSAIRCLQWAKIQIYR